jgi:molybdenum cofactor biosynthesis protein B
MDVNIALLTVTDTRTFDNDKSGAILVEKIKEAKHQLIDRKICKDNKEDIVKILKEWTNQKDIDVIITTGGTGLTGRDITPEVMETLFEKSIDGFGEMFRWLSFSKIGTSALQSRALAGVSNGTYIFCLPGSPSACKDGWDDILSHQLDIRHKPCNFVEIMPRLQEHKAYRSKT